MKTRYLLVLGCLLMVACNQPVADKGNAPAKPTAAASETPSESNASKPKPSETKPSETKPKSPEDQFASLEDDYDAAMKTFRKAYSAAKTREEKNQVFKEQYPNGDEFAAGFLKLAEDNPQDEIAPKALLWVVNNIRQGDSGTTAIDRLLANFIDHEDLDSICMSLAYGKMNSKTVGRLKLLKEKSPHDEVKAAAIYNLAKFYSNLQSTKERIDADEKMAEYYEEGEVAFLNDFDFSEMEVESLYQTISDKYADLKPREDSPKTYGDMAGAALFEMNNLQIGNVAPDIEGEDLDGTSFKLSDYRGKVVLLDFWGDW